jgi:predicted nucleotidyltransferase
MNIHGVSSWATTHVVEPKAMLIQTQPQKPMAMTREEVAYHEAGHAVLAWVLGSQVRSVVIYSDGSGGETQTAPATEQEGRFIICFAGSAAQRRFGRVEAWHAYSDLGNAIKLAETHEISEDRASELIGKAHELVAEHWANIERVAVALIAGGRLNVTGVDALLGPPLPRVKLSNEQLSIILDWADRERVINAVRLYGSRAKGFARSHSDIDLAVTTSFGHYVALAAKWKDSLTDRLGVIVHVKQYNSPGDEDRVRAYCDAFSELLFDRKAL